jgi:cell fate (sporulation/competence/biofilm development) regulator YlbF (YheA/YmcA/DUF963 family)
MDFRDAYIEARSLRNLLRRADKFGYSLQELKEEILEMAEAKEDFAEKEEMKHIIELQKAQL